MVMLVTRGRYERARAARRVLCVAVVAVCGVVACALPGPVTRLGTLPDDFNLRSLCGGDESTSSFVLEGAESLTGAIECSRSGVVIVLLNSFGVRVRTIRITLDRRLQDEVSYLAQDADSAQRVIERARLALAARNQKN